MTKVEHRKRVKAWGQKYARQIRLPDQLIDQYVEYAVREVWRMWMLTNPGKFRTSASFAHGDRVPTDWIQYANRGYVTTLGVRAPINWIEVQRIGVRKTSTYNVATAATPDVYILDQKIYFLPDSTMTDPGTAAPYVNIAAATLFYYKRPPKLFGTSVADSTDDGLPQNASLWAGLLAFRRCLEHYYDKEKRQLLADQTREESFKRAKLFVEGLALGELKDPRTRTST